jgi:tRNA nucleotidyltransferase (CCA-adding enzyme)
LKLFRFLHSRLCYTKNVKQTVTAVPKSFAWWVRRFPDSAIDRPIIYLMALSSESSQAVMATMIRRLVFSREQAKRVSSGGRLLDHALKRLTKERTIRPSKVYRLLADFPNEAIVLLVAKQASKQQGVELGRLKRRLVAYMKNRTMKTALTGRDLQAMGLQPGPQYKTILGKLLDARIDGVVTTEAEERVFVREWLG